MFGAWPVAWNARLVAICASRSEAKSALKPTPRAEMRDWRAWLEKLLFAADFA